ncbi:MAG TPA: N-6 DNA methylase [Candidatus Acidoferrales bacterium]|nr:N-6 DNA methylase [Candidatus Acidoferrales bacterium]
MPPATIETFSRDLERLIKKFDADKPHYLSKSYNEAQARVDFVSPFFKALGWDMENEQGLPHHSREVVVELGEDTHGRPDYGFRVAAQTKFFVEAKAPCEALDTGRHIMQAKKYAWNTKQVSFVVLTDFEEFRFYDASIIPDERKPDEGLLLNFRYIDYLANISKIWDFSPERVAAGSLEALLPRDRRTQRLRIPVDTAFLDEMTGWREELAKNIYKNNPALTARQLNEVVQRLLDRIVFIRVAEDRRVIEKNQLRDVVEEWKARRGKFHIFEGLNDLFHRINEDFNGEIFKQHLSDKIKIDSEVLARIIERLYPPKSPYRFDVIGVELLGSIYERYLGKTIRVTPKQVRVEERPEVRKAGGVYYTPKYIVDYIVKNTVGKLIEGKTPKQIEKIRILDPACGSGSFLIGAFQCLIDYHARYLSEHPKEAQIHALFPDITRDPNSEPRLSVIRKAQILKNNLFGVDIDPQAVEITMMSLYLKALEGERSQLPPKQHLLPELKNNIICGNSLIGPDIYNQATLFGDDERDRINAFDWNSEVAGFGRIMKDGGFDAVIGNPPYSYMISGTDQDYFSKHYVNQDYQKDLYLLFLERYHFLLKKRGLVGSIVSNTWLQSITLRKIRHYLVNDFQWIRVLYLPEKVFSAVVDTHVIILQKGQPTQGASFVVDVRRSGKIWQLHSLPQRLLPSSGDPINVTSPAHVHELVHRIRACSSPLSSVCEVYNGIKPFEVGKGTPPQTRAIAESQPFVREGPRPSKEWKPLLRGGLIDRYANLWDKDYWVLYGPWLAAPRDGRIFDAPLKIMVRQTGDSIVATLVEGGFIARNNMHILLPRSADCDLRYVLGLMNSAMMDFAYTFMNPEKDEALAEVKKRHVEDLPIKTDKAQHDRIVALVEQMLELNKKKHSGKLAPSELDRLERELATTDAQIDDLVYNLYGITAEERKVIEEKLLTNMG